MRGSCLCGDCEFEIEGDPGRVGKCHCSKCRKVSGTGSNAVFWLRPDNLKWIKGESSTTTYSMPDGWGTVRCARCGSPLPALVGGRMWIVPAGLLDEEPGVGVRGHVWVENKPHWEVIGDDAPQFLTVPPE
ncbi:MAG: GFA family protein [Gammaproteobacteria bacterium]|nr:GFA family protein [Gammaproteobacteria bacterium]